MSADTRLFGGIMSGTSLDGVDAALLEIRGSDPKTVQWSLTGFHTSPYAPEERQAIRAAMDSGGVQELALLSGRLGRAFAKAFGALLEETGVDATAVSAVGSHGQTVWHEPPNGERVGATLQIGDSSTIAEWLGIPVVDDFRSRDVAAGGHGAPLVPWGDWVMLRRAGRGRALQNLGGMGNVTFLPREGGLEDVRGFDTGPGVALLDRAAHRASRGQAAWDVNGERAARGTVVPSVLEELMADPFFAEEPPRSTGRERFGDRRLEEIVASVGPREDADWDDLLATLTVFTARSVADSYRRFLPIDELDEVVLTGGGANNPTLVEALREALEPIPVDTGRDALGIDPDAREAAVFALLAWARLESLPGNLPRVTGARGPRVLGSLHPGGEGRGRT